MTPLGTGMVEYLDPLLARHVCVLRLAAAATEAADEACLLLLARAAMPLSWAVVSRLHQQFYPLSLAHFLSQMLAGTPCKLL